MNATLEQGITMTVVGLVIVFFVLALISFVVSLVSRLDARWQQRERELERAALDKPANIDATTAVLIAAAVATYVGGRARIRSVRRLLPTDLPSSPWSSQGRAVLQGSHLIQRPRR